LEIAMTAQLNENEQKGTVPEDLTAKIDKLEKNLASLEELGKTPPKNLNQQQRQQVISQWQELVTQWRALNLKEKNPDEYKRLYPRIFQIEPLYNAVLIEYFSTLEGIKKADSTEYIQQHTKNLRDCFKQLSANKNRGGEDTTAEQLFAQYRTENLSEGAQLLVKKALSSIDDDKQSKEKKSSNTGAPPRQKVNPQIQQFEPSEKPIDIQTLKSLNEQQNWVEEQNKLRNLFFVLLAAAGSGAVVYFKPDEIKSAAEYAWNNIKENPMYTLGITIILLGIAGFLKWKDIKGKRADEEIAVQHYWDKATDGTEAKIHLQRAEKLLSLIQDRTKIASLLSGVLREKQHVGAGEIAIAIGTLATASPAAAAQILLDYSKQGKKNMLATIDVLMRLEFSTEGERPSAALWNALDQLDPEQSKQIQKSYCELFRTEIQKIKIRKNRADILNAAPPFLLAEVARVVNADDKLLVTPKTRIQAELYAITPAFDRSIYRTSSEKINTYLTQGISKDFSQAFASLATFDAEKAAYLLRAALTNSNSQTKANHPQIVSLFGFILSQRDGDRLAANLLLKLDTSPSTTYAASILVALDKKADPIHEKMRAQDRQGHTLIRQQAIRKLSEGQNVDQNLQQNYPVGYAELQLLAIVQKKGLVTFDDLDLLAGMFDSQKPSTQPVAELPIPSEEKYSATDSASALIRLVRYYPSAARRLVEFIERNKNQYPRLLADITNLVGKQDQKVANQLSKWTTPLLTQGMFVLQDNLVQPSSSTPVQRPPENKPEVVNSDEGIGIGNGNGNGNP
jgi:hypothetical protein